MKLENILRLCEGELLNKPKVFSFLDFTSNLKKIKRGSLYFCKDARHICDALTLGAYGVIFETTVDIDEHECALIKVPSVERAALKLLRYLHIKKRVKALTCDKIEFEIIKKLSLGHKELLFVENPLLSLKELSELDENTIIVTQNDELAEILDAQKIEKARSLESFHVISQNILSITIFYKGFIHKSIPFQSIFIKELQSSLLYLKALEIELDITKLGFLKYLEPLFYDNSGHIAKDQNGTCVLFEEDIELFEKMYLYLKLHAKWAKTLIVANEKYGEQLSFDGEVWLLKKFDEHILENGKYDFVLANFGKPHKKEKKEQTLGLFDEF